MEYQLFETVPKDGTNIFAWAEGYEWPEVVRFEHFSAHEANEVGEPGYWRYSDDVLSDVCVIEPGEFTHWMPIPAPPAIVVKKES